MAPADKPKSYVKLICAGWQQRVVGLHIIGMAAGEQFLHFILKLPWIYRTKWSFI